MGTWLNTILFVGITEEIVFRGFLLKKLNLYLSFKKAAVISSILFIFIHYPFWYAKGELILPIILFNSIYIFCFGFVQSYTLKKTDSLWACIISHSVHNFIMSILF